MFNGLQRNIPTGRAPQAPDLEDSERLSENFARAGYSRLAAILAAHDLARAPVIFQPVGCPTDSRSGDSRRSGRGGGSRVSSESCDAENRTAEAGPLQATVLVAV